MHRLPAGHATSAWFMPFLLLETTVQINCFRRHHTSRHQDPVRWLARVLPWPSGPKFSSSSRNVISRGSSSWRSTSPHQEPRCDRQTWIRRLALWLRQQPLLHGPNLGSQVSSVVLELKSPSCQRLFRYKTSWPGCHLTWTIYRETQLCDPVHILPRICTDSERDRLVTRNLDHSMYHNSDSAEGRLASNLF